MPDLAVIENNVNRVVKDTDDQWVEIGKLRDNIKTLMTKYVPIWVVVVISCMSGITGAALTFAGMVFRMYIAGE